MAVYVNYSSSSSTPPEGTCVFCTENLKDAFREEKEGHPLDSGLQLVAHFPTGIEHPLHRKCAKQLHQAGFEYCLVCFIRCEPLSLYSRNEQLFRRLYYFLRRFNGQHLTALAIGAAGFWVSHSFSKLLLSDSFAAARIHGIAIAVVGTLGYCMRKSKGSLSFVLGSAAIYAIKVLARDLLQAVASNGYLKEQGLYKAFGAVIAYNLLSDRESRWGEYFSWISLVALPIFASLLGASTAAFAETAVISATTLSVLAFSTTLIEVFGADRARRW